MQNTTQRRSPVPSSRRSISPVISVPVKVRVGSPSDEGNLVLAWRAVARSRQEHSSQEYARLLAVRDTVILPQQSQSAALRYSVIPDRLKRFERTTKTVRSDISANATPRPSTSSGPRSPSKSTSPQSQASPSPSTWSNASCGKSRGASTATAGSGGTNSRRSHWYQEEVRRSELYKQRALDPRLAKRQQHQLVQRQPTVEDPRSRSQSETRQ
jgi:hypothetical protein